MKSQHHLKPILLFFFCFAFQVAFSQKTTNLEYRLKYQREDSVKVNSLLSVARYYDRKAFDKSEKYGHQALELSKKISFTRGTAKSAKFLGHFYYYKGELKHALNYFTKAAKAYTTLKDDNNAADVYLNIGIVYHDMCDYKSAMKYYLFVKNEGKRLHMNDLIAYSCSDIGMIYDQLGDYPSALEMHYEALKYYEFANDKTGIADSYNNLANVYAEQNELVKAVNMYQASLSLAKQINDRTAIGNAYINLGLTYDEMGRYEDAVNVLGIAYSMSKEDNNIKNVAVTMTALSFSYNNLGRYEEALANGFKAMEICKAIDNKTELACCYYNIGNIYIKQNKLKEAREMLTTSAEISKAVSYKMNLSQVYASMVKLDSMQHNFAAAFDHHKLYILYRDSINNEESENKSYQIGIKYAFEKKALEQKQKNDKAIFNLKEKNELGKQRQFYLVAIVMGLIISALIVFFFARRAYNSKKQYNNVLSNENKHKELLLQEVHHRVNNSLQMISSLLSIQAGSTANEEIREYLLKSENRVRSMSVMHQLLHSGNSSLEVNIKTYFEEILLFYGDMANTNKGILLNVSVPSEMFHTKSAMPLAIILNELLTNSLKYAFPGKSGKIDVTLQRTAHKNEWLFEVKDDGIGFDPDHVTSNEESLGLNLVELMSKQIGAHINISGKNGTTVRVIFETGNET